MLTTSIARLLATCAAGLLVAGCVTTQDNGYYDPAPIYPSSYPYGGAYSTYPQVYPAYPVQQQHFRHYEDRRRWLKERERERAREIRQREKERERQTKERERERQARQRDQHKERQQQRREQQERETRQREEGRAQLLEQHRQRFEREREQRGR